MADLSHRRIQSTGDIPSVELNACPECFIRNTFMRVWKKFTNCEAFIAKNVSSVADSVIGLFDFGRPSTVSGFIVFVIVDTFDRMLCRRSWPNILKKSQEVCFPQRRNCYPSSFVSLKILTSLSTSAAHYTPDFKFWCIRFTMCASSHGLVNYPKSQMRAT